MTPDFIPIQRPSTTGADAEALVDVLASGWLTTGPTVKRFEEALGDYLGVPAISTSNATASMFLALQYWGIGPGDEVIVPAYTFVASAHAVVQLGATPVFCDVEAGTRGLDADAAASLVTARTRALLPVHLFGNPTRLDGLLALAARHDLRVLEDAAQAFGARLGGRLCGTIGDAGAYSFHARKIITTAEGGAIGSSDEAMLAKIRRVRNNGVDRNPYDRDQVHDGGLPDVDCLGYNSRLPDLNAALGLVQLARLDELLARNAAHAARYQEAFADLEGVETPQQAPGGEPAWQAFNLRLLSEAPVSPGELIAHLTKRGVRAMQASHFVPELTFYRERAGYAPGRFPVAELLARRCVAIPLFPGLRDDERERVIEAVRELWVGVRAEFGARSAVSES
jgi:dTDP-4-amino-4,6-dideoxygalactose transaminase